MNENILVSVCCITYNHAPFIRQCLDGFLMQKTNFDIEVLIHDDASNDGTIDIIKEYEAKYPEIIKPIIQKENQYSQGKRGFYSKYNFPRAKGRYIAMCEGDDYWTDPLKLQKQVDFLEENEEYVLVCTNYTSDAINKKSEVEDREITPSEVLLRNPIGTLTTMFRARLTETVRLNSEYVMGDYPLWLELLKYGKAYKLKDYTAHYRILPTSVSGRNNINKMVNFDKDVVLITNNYLNVFETNKKTKKKILFERYSYLIIKLLRVNKREALFYFFQYMKLSPYFNIRDFAFLFKIILMKK